MRGVVDIPDHLLGVQNLVLGFLERVELCFDEQLASDLPAVRDLCQQVARYRGKMLRPTLVAVCGVAACDGLDAMLRSDPHAALSDEHARAGAVCEMVHMATLVHDDVLDEAAVRRRGATVNALRGNETAVILGDYLIASAYELCSRFESTVPARLIGRASTVMCAGELLQLHSRDDASLDEATYFEILERKTAALIGAACELGVLCTIGFDAGDHALTHAAGRYGRRLGIAFQIQDDLLDLTGDQETVGKSVGKDLEKGKLTFPLIHHLGSVDPLERGRTLRLLADHHDESSARALLQALGSSGSLGAARERAERLVADAKRALGVFPEGPGKELMLLMADAVVARSH